MTGPDLKHVRKRRKLTQVELAARLGVSQTYVALLEAGKRPVPPSLSRKAVRLLDMAPSSLPVTDDPFSIPSERLASELGALGYPGFLHLRAHRKRNPTEVLLSALAKENLESRVAEGLPWLVLKYAPMSDANKSWLLQQSRLRNLTNRVGFVVSLAKQVTMFKGDTTSARYRSLTELEQELRYSRLDREDTLCQASLSQNERDWLRQVRPPYAAEWHLLTNWRPEYLQYAS